MYEGDWQNGKRCGQGVLAVIGPNGIHTKIYSGLWKDDKRHVSSNSLFISLFIGIWGKLVQLLRIL